MTLSEVEDEREEVEMLGSKAIVHNRVLGLGLMAALMGACGSGSDLGTCVIMTTGDDAVIENISLEERQERGLDVPGARGLEWTPNR